MAVGIGLNNFGKILRFNPDISAFDWPSVGSFTIPSRADVPAAQTVKVTSSEPTKLRATDFGSIVEYFRGFSLTIQSRVLRRPEGRPRMRLAIPFLSLANAAE